MGGPSPPAVVTPIISICCMVAVDWSACVLQLPSAFRPAAENCDEMPRPRCCPPLETTAVVMDSEGAAAELQVPDAVAVAAADEAGEFSELASAAGMVYSCGTVIMLFEVEEFWLLLRPELMCEEWLWLWLC